MAIKQPQQQQLVRKKMDDTKVFPLDDGRRMANNVTIRCDQMNDSISYAFHRKRMRSIHSKLKMKHIACDFRIPLLFDDCKSQKLNQRTCD